MVKDSSRCRHEEGWRRIKVSLGQRWADWSKSSLFPVTVRTGLRCEGAGIFLWIYFIFTAKTVLFLLIIYLYFLVKHSTSLNL